MIVIVCAGKDPVPWPLVRRTLDYFHARQAITLIVGGNLLAKRWATERDIRIDDSAGSAGAELGAMDKHRPKLMIALPGQGLDLVIEAARHRGIKVVEVV